MGLIDFDGSDERDLNFDMLRDQFAVVISQVRRQVVVMRMGMKRRMCRKDGVDSKEMVSNMATDTNLSGRQLSFRYLQPGR